MPVIVGITLKNKGYIDFKIEVDNPLSSFAIKDGEQVAFLKMLSIQMK